ncbi:MAG: glycosyltransferase family 2 protein [Thermoanaerobaculales bacterium]
MNEKVQAVVVRWRGGDEVRRCLASLIAHGGTSLGSVVLVDSGSGDGGAERLAAEFADVRVVALAENRSFAHAAGCGVAEGDEPLVLLLNPDAEVRPGSIGTLVSFLTRSPEAAGAVPILEGIDGVAQYRWQLRKLPTVARLALGLPGAPAFKAPPERPTAVAQPAAAAWLVRRTVWDALGGLDPGFVRAWWEDVDFCARLDAGLKAPGFPASEPFIVVPQARMSHLGGSSVSKLTEPEFLTAFNRNLLLYASRHHPHRLALIRRSLRLSLAGRALLHPSRRAAYRAASAAVAETG